MLFKYNEAVEINFDLKEAQNNILEKYPEWRELMDLVEFKNIPEVNPAGCSDNIVYYNRRRMRQYPTAVQEFYLAEQLMHLNTKSSIVCLLEKPLVMKDGEIYKNRL